MKPFEVRGGVTLYWTRAYDVVGRMIYEGDVVRVHDVRRNMNKYILVKWEKSSMSWNLGKFKKSGNLFNVVGNIYQDQGLSKLL